MISEVLNIYKSVLVIKGTVEEKSMTLFVRKNSHTATSQVTERCIAFLRRGIAGNFELSPLIETHESFTIDAFSTLFRASETGAASHAKDILTADTFRPKADESETEDDSKITVAPPRVGTTQPFQDLILEFAKMTPEQQKEVEKEAPSFHKVAVRMAPRMLKVAAQKRKQP